MSRETDLQGFSPKTIAIPLGITASVLISSEQLGVAGVLQYVSGGTCWILGATTGLTASGATLLATYTGGTAVALLMSGLALNYDGSPRFYLGATSATCVVQIVGGLSSGI